MTQPAPAPGEATTERVRGIFSHIAGSYDTFNTLSSMGIDRTWRSALVKAGNFDAGSRVLDLCAGTGDVGLTIAKVAQPSEVVITDFTPEMLEIAEQKGASYAGRSLLTYKLVDAQDIPFDDDSFDVVTVSFGVRNLPERERNFAEVLRVLKPGGRYVILEFSRPSFGPWRGVYHVYLRNVIPAIGGLLTKDRESFVYLNDSIRRFPTQPQLAAELREAGFGAITWKNLTGGIAALHTAIK